MGFLKEGENSLADIANRIAPIIAKQELTPEKVVYWEERFRWVLENGYIIPSGRIIRNLTETRIGNIRNCFVLCVYDDIQSIAKLLHDITLISSMGGGWGVDFSKIRPEGDIILTKGGVASGPLSYMKCVDAIGGQLRAGGTRRSAGLVCLEVSHPDIYKFIDSKINKHELQNLNISVGITNEFLDAVKANKDWDLKFKGKVYQTIQAKELWEYLLNNSIKHAEPGWLNLSNIRYWNSGSFYEQDVLCNACGEITGEPLTSCMLSSINLHSMVENGEFNYKKLAETTKIAQRFLDNIATVGDFPLEANKATSERGRRIGIGIIGEAHALIELKIKYGTEEHLELIDKFMTIIRDSAYEASIETAQEKGYFSAFNQTYLDTPWARRLPRGIRAKIKEFGIRNVALLSNPPCLDGESLILDNNKFNILSDGNGNTYKAWYTKRAPTITLIANNGLELKCTPEHLIMLEDDTFVEAKNTMNKAVAWGLGNRKATKRNDNMILLGFLFGDGFRGGQKTNNNSTGIQVKLNPIKEPCIEVMLLKYGFTIQRKGAGTIKGSNGKLYNCTNTNIYYCNRDKLSNKLQQNLDFLDNRCSSRNIPKNILYGDSNIIASFISGLYSANGSVTSRDGTISFKTTNNNLVKQLQIILASFGIKSYFYKNKSNDSALNNQNYKTKESYNLEIYKNNNINFAQFIGFIEEKKQNKIQFTKIQRRRKLIIKEIKTNEDTDVYDFSMINRKVYNFVNGFIVHNCGDTGIFAGLSHGIEPIPSKIYKRAKKHHFIDPLYEKYKDKKEYGPYFIGMFDVTPKQHLEVQAEHQKYIDNAVSKTVNVSKGKVKEFREVILNELSNLKGTTIYVEGSREEQITTIDEESTGECTGGVCQIDKPIEG